MSKYKGLFTFDVENHRYLPVEQADGLITEMDYHPEPEPKEPLIRHEGIRKTFRDWCVENGLDESEFRYYNNGTLRSTADDNYSIWFLQLALHARLQEGIDYTFTDLCGEEEE